MKNLFLIRHAQSTQNIGDNLYEKKPDHKVELTWDGKQEARARGIWLNERLLEENIDLANARLYVSPFMRTRQTAELLNESLKIQDVVEDYLLIEHQYGLFSDTKWSEVKKLYPDFFEYYERFYQNEGKFYLRFPMGESPMDVAVRTRMFLTELEKVDIDNIFIVSHGTTLKTMIMNIYGYNPDWYAHNPGFGNLEVRQIDEDKKMKILCK